MLEIIALYFMCKKIGSMLRNKGYTPIWLQILVVLFWFGGEIIGAVSGVVLMAVINGGGGEGLNPVIYLGALAGAGIGAGLAFLIATLLPDRNRRPEGFPVDPHD